MDPTLRKILDYAGHAFAMFIILAIVTVCWCGSCPGEASAQESSTKTAGTPVLDHPNKDSSSAEIAQAWAEREQAAMASAIFDIAAWVGLGVVVLVVGVIMIRAIRGRRKRIHAATTEATAQSAPSIPPKPQCPVCRKPTDDDTVSLPRLVRPRRTVYIGSYTIILPDVLADQTVKVCPLCYEVAVTLCHIEQARLAERRARDERAEIEYLKGVQEGMPDDIKRIRFPESKEPKAS